MFKCFLFAFFNKRLLVFIDFQHQCLFVCMCCSVCRDQAIPVKRVTLPLCTVAEAFFFISMLTLLPVFCLHTCLSLHLVPDLSELYTEAHVSVGSFRRRAGPAGPTMEEIPQAHMELLSPVLTLTGTLQLFELRAGHQKLGG